MTGIGTSWAACLICRHSVFTGGSGAEVEWWMDRHPARCPGPQEGPKLVRWQEDVFAEDYCTCDGPWPCPKAGDVK